jgi:hypothetical protein
MGGKENSPVASPNRRAKHAPARFQTLVQTVAGNFLLVYLPCCGVAGVHRSRPATLAAPRSPTAVNRRVPTNPPALCSCLQARDTAQMCVSDWSSHLIVGGYALMVDALTVCGLSRSVAFRCSHEFIPFPLVMQAEVSRLLVNLLVILGERVRGSPSLGLNRLSHVTLCAIPSHAERSDGRSTTELSRVRFHPCYEGMFDCAPRRPLLDRAVRDASSTSR